ncbi:MAG TPA: ThiF family adenylyltransferase [Thermoanaerobaculia bacterium]|nr:ThiF family adenylyltransferase [Thermoanaerobaculia bacterium]
MSESRHSRSERFSGILPEGQRRLGRSSVAIVGVGAVGSVAAEIAVRAGFGGVTLIDRDVVEESNLQRQFLFDAEDARRGAPKAEAAARHLGMIDPAVRLRAEVADLGFRNADALLAGHDVVIDGCDNFETRLLVSDWGKKNAVPTVYGAAVGAEGIVSVSMPAPDWPCLRCYLGALPPAGSSPTCDTVGIVPSLPPLVASLAAGEALRIAVGRRPSRGVLTFSVWEGDVRPVRAFAKARPREGCDACAGRRYPALEGEGATEVVRLCGRNAVQIAPAGRERPDFDRLERALEGFAVQRSANVLSFPAEGVVLTLFSDGRCVVRGTEDFDRARSLYAKYVGR